MASKKCANYLCEYLPDEFFWDVVFLFGTLFDDLAQIALSTVLHHNVNHLSLAIDYAVVVANNVCMSQVPQDVHLGHDLLPLFFVHLPIVELFPD